VRQELPHISVCICTYQRPVLLRRLLNELSEQETGGLFTYSVVVADNDQDRSGEIPVAEMMHNGSLSIKYCVEPTRGISPTRNRAIASAEGEYLAFIDDDELPVSNWLFTLFTTCNDYAADGVLGPVRRRFEESPPRWLQKSRFYDRRVNPTGMQVKWPEARTGNVLLKREILIGDPSPFRPEFRVGEDQDFFRRKMGEGRVFIWSAEAEAFEVIPPARWKRIYMMKKALLRGACAALQPSCGFGSVLKSAIAVPIYGFCLPIAQLAGHHHFMTLLVKLCDHIGKLFAVAGFHPIKDAYVGD
jgi:glycosyltransferase involved in cell wall biosynthesis